MALCVLLVIAAGTGLRGADREANGPDPAGATAGGWVAADAGAASEGAPPTVVSDARTALERASGTVARRDGDLAQRDLRRELTAARRGGGSPIALVETATTLSARPGRRSLGRLGTETEFGSPRVLAVVGHQRGWLEVMAAELDNGETGWVSADDVEVGGVDYSLHAGLAERILEVRRHGAVVRRIPVAIGGPATPTPTGSFAVTDKLRVVHDSPYGCCALAFTGHQPNVPQGWSGGDRLAVHATPHEATIGHAATLGCFRAAEGHMRWLVNRVPLGTPVTVTP